MIRKQYTLRTLLLASTLVAAYLAAYRTDYVQAQMLEQFVDRFNRALDEGHYDTAESIACAASQQFPKNKVVNAMLWKASFISGYSVPMVGGAYFIDPEQDPSMVATGSARSWNELTKQRHALNPSDTPVAQ